MKERNWMLSGIETEFNVIKEIWEISLKMWFLYKDWKVDQAKGKLVICGTGNRMCNGVFWNN